MKTDVLIQTLEDSRFRAVGSGHFADVCGEGRTRAEALNNFRVAAQKYRTPENEVVTLELDEPEVPVHPALKYAGDMKDDPLFDAWQDAIEENRRIENEREGIFLDQHYPPRLRH